MCVQYVCVCHVCRCYEKGTHSLSLSGVRRYNRLYNSVKSVPILPNAINLAILFFLWFMRSLCKLYYTVWLFSGSFFKSDLRNILTYSIKERYGVLLNRRFLIMEDKPRCGS